MYLNHIVMENTQLQSIKFEISPSSYQSLEQLIIKCVAAGIAQTQPPSVLVEEIEEKFSIPGLAKYLECSISTIHNYKKRGIFPYYQTGRTIYFKKSDVDKSLEVSGKKKGR
jgi:excisionase family DNA binding protein